MLADENSGEDFLDNMEDRPVEYSGIAFGEFILSFLQIRWSLGVGGIGALGVQSEIAFGMFRQSKCCVLRRLGGIHIVLWTTDSKTDGHTPTTMCGRNSRHPFL